MQHRGETQLVQTCALRRMLCRLRWATLNSGALPEVTALDVATDWRVGAPSPATSGRRRLSADDRSSVLALYGAGVAVSEIAEVVGCHRSTVARLVAGSSVERRRRGLDPAEVEVAVERYVAGESLKAIGFELGVHGDTVRRVLRSTGVEIRPQVQPAKPRLLSDEDVRECRVLRESGVSVSELARERGVHRETMRRALHR